MITAESSYPVSDWNEAIEAGREWEWCPTDTQENTPGNPGWMGQWLAENVIGWDMKFQGVNDYCDGITDEMVEAALTVLVQKRQDPVISGNELLAALKSYRGNTVDDFRTLAEEDAEEDGIELVFLGGEPTEHDYHQWYMSHGVKEGDVYAATSAGGTLYWFDSHQW